MFVIRQATADDAPALLKLAKMVHFINLPADPDIITNKIMRSHRSFAGRPPSPREREFIFVLENAETGNVIGTSAIVSCISWPGHAHVFLKVRKRELYSEDLQTGAVHVTLELGSDESGPSEIGGLILAPSYRGHKDKLGGLLSLIRFHLMGLQRSWFSDRIIAEMMGALTPASRNLLWEYLGRRFINLEYTEADRFCQHSKEFITSLFPKGEIYVSLLPAEARKLIGHVGTETQPAMAMLTRLGFEFRGDIDPFDGGPYLEADVDAIPHVKATRHVTLAKPSRSYPHCGLVSFRGDRGFRAVRTQYAGDGDTISIPRAAMDAIQAAPGETGGLTPLATRAARKGKSKPKVAGKAKGKPKSPSKDKSKGKSRSKAGATTRKKTGRTKS